MSTHESTCPQCGDTVGTQVGSDPKPVITHPDSVCLWCADQNTRREEAKRCVG